MKAVVTGGAGFIGSHLVKALLEGGAVVHVIDNLSSGKREQVAPGAVLHTEDVRSAEAKRIIAAVKPELVYHLAAQADVQQSILAPSLDASVNVTGTINILDACKEACVNKIIFSSTSGVYGNLAKERITERDPAIPISFYGLSKLTAERYIHMYSQLYCLSYTILRYGNVYGPGQTAKGEGGVIANFMERALGNLPLYINGDGEQTRDFIYVGDVVRANWAAANYGDQETIHVSTGKRTSVNRIVQLLRDMHPAEIPIHYRPAQSGDIMHSCLANQKAIKSLRWDPAVSIEQGVAETYRSWSQHQ
ncbi:UDP-glucose 4-epimerase [Paenibacillus taihuensis]|uniref:UDP-glucose 4-epimerase n=1 Tax=Paenibacillus taihuensis TaxID=1156355 RepID=A0A3D9R2P9_9BACL|nr:NAD-dependent epimerase/dehydratase family protein [Paenibacillus taihuensis]REE66701.1 UDP-glucose 4-epimerase [Paenibacillus taihuensis]